jgi:hypothetical protein
MMQRRAFFSEAAFAGAAGAAIPHETTVHGQHVFPELDAVREAQKTYLRTTGKFPDFIEVGTNVWHAIYDWHVRFRQPITIGRDSAGRYTLPVTHTTVVLRPEQTPAFIGPPYDSK